METRKRARGRGGEGEGNRNYEKLKFRGMEENTMVILDTSNSATLHHHLDDRLAFLDAVRSASLVPENGTAPTNKMLEAIFGILKDEDSLYLIVGSYQLLNELDKRYPRAYLSKTEKAGSPSSSKVVSELIVVEEAWSPFNLGLDISSSEEESNKTPCESIAPLGFQSLIEDIAKRANAKVCDSVEMKSLRKMLLLQYLVNVLEGDFLARNLAFKENMNWNLVRGSILNMILIIQLDSSRNVADIHGLITRADGVRIPAIEVILDELTYNSDLLSPFLQAFDEPEWKLNLIVLYFQKYIPKSSVRTRRSNGLAKDATFDGILKCLSNRNSAKSIIKKIGTEVVQLLLAHAFQAYLSLSSRHSAEDVPDSEEMEGSGLVETCKNIISAFTSLKNENKESEYLLFSREALFTAVSILSMKS